MRRRALAALALILLTTPVFASKLEQSLESRWRGAWIVTRVDVQSDCNGMRTDNDVRGTLLSSRGRYPFRAGELARIDKVDLHRSRIDLVLNLPEPKLVS